MRLFRRRKPAPGAPLCALCNGSGEGMTDGSRCSACGGCGHEMDDYDEGDYRDEDREREDRRERAIEWADQRGEHAR